MSEIDQVKPKEFTKAAARPYSIEDEHPIVVALYILGGIAAGTAGLACFVLWPHGASNMGITHLMAISILWVGCSVGAILAGLGLAASYLRRICHKMNG